MHFKKDMKTSKRCHNVNTGKALARNILEIALSEIARNKPPPSLLWKKLNEAWQLVTLPL